MIECEFSDAEKIIVDNLKEAIKTKYDSKMKDYKNDNTIFVLSLALARHFYIKIKNESNADAHILKYGPMTYIDVVDKTPKSGIFMIFDEISIIIHFDKGIPFESREFIRSVKITLMRLPTSTYGGLINVEYSIKRHYDFDQCPNINLDVFITSYETYTKTSEIPRWIFAFLHLSKRKEYDIKYLNHFWDSTPYIQLFISKKQLVEYAKMLEERNKHLEMEEK